MNTSGPLRVHVLFESSHRGEPHGCSFIRLLQPLSHPSIAGRLHLSAGLDLPVTAVDVVIVERLWDYGADRARVEKLLADMRRRGLPFIYEIDDDLINVNSRAGDREAPTLDQRLVIRHLARQAAGVVVSTAPLSREFAVLNPHVEVVPNYLDDRLFAPQPRRRDDGDHVTFGYMGTFTHLEDLMGVIAPIRRILHRERDRLRFEIVGVGHRAELEALMPDLPVTFRDVPAASVPYVPFVRWMHENLSWDFAIAPLGDSRFSRSKSDIKFLDYSALGIPGIYADVPAYRGTVENGRNGLLVAETTAAWEEALTTMTRDAARRQAMAEAAESDVRSARMLDKGAARWLAAIEAILARHAAGPVARPDVQPAA